MSASPQVHRSAQLHRSAPLHHLPQLQLDPRAQTTLRQAFERYHRTASHRPSTVADYHSMLKHWERLTHDPYIGEIDNLTLRNFRESLLVNPPPGRSRPVSPTTVAKNIRYAQAILATCGPQQHGNPEGLGILPSIPVCGKPPVNHPPVVTAEDSEICDIYHACDVATWPRYAMDRDRECGILILDPALWWRSLLVYLYNVGSRLGEFLSLRTSQLDFTRKRLTIDAEKHGSQDYKPMHPVLAEHLQLFVQQAPRTYVFACPNNQTYLRRQWYAIQEEAGIVVPREAQSNRHPYYGFHEIRKTCGTNLSAISLAAAQHQLGHKSINTTRRHYVKGSRVVEAIENQITQPTAFTRPTGHDPTTPPGRPRLRIVG